MKKAFLDDNFLLGNETAQRLYHQYAANMPIIDYHCHLSPQEIYENKTYASITELWLYGDHYKWRAMRANGAEEQYVTGEASDYDKFVAYARTLPAAIGNPLYHWSHLELQRYFGVFDVMNERTAPAIWDKVNSQLSGPGFGVRDFIRKSNVTVICTTDDPLDSLEYHMKLKEDDSFDTAVLPSFRPDKGLEINRDTFVPWVEKLGVVCGRPIASFGQFLQALEERVMYFHDVGCRVSDHALDVVPFAETNEQEAAAIFAKALGGSKVTPEEEMKHKTFTLVFLGKLYAKLGWAMQYHMNALRNRNPRMFAQLGPDTGYDAIGDSAVAEPLSRLLAELDRDDLLPRTIVYSLNPVHNYALAALTGCFQGGGVPGKIQLGAAWWFNDTKEGMLAQLKTLADVGLLGRFVGMLTDSRSFLSFTRHEYFRRLLCNMLGEWVENGEFPDDEELLRGLVQDISYNNAKAYFGF